MIYCNAKEVDEIPTSSSEIVDGVNAERKRLGMTDFEYNDPKSVAYKDHYTIGNTYTLTGEIDLTVPIRENGIVINTYIGLKTNEGTIISLVQFMGISSLNNYSINSNDVFIQEYDNSNGVKVSMNVSPDVMKGYTATDIVKILFQPESRNLYEEAAALMDNPSVIRGKRVTFMGTAYRPFVARTSNPYMHFKAGYKCVMVQRLWALGERKPK
jgi:hypothetical protein